MENYCNIKENELYTITEIANLFHIDRRTLYHLRDRGEIVFIKLGPKQTRITGASAIAYLNKYNANK
ncbi:MAG: helix-turn-helix domain-containing protein [Treponemataceae bacterium]|nr:helix-turn-helix domain-containing protein [Treponemataceae bacterium]